MERFYYITMMLHQVFLIHQMSGISFFPLFSHHECISVAKYEGHYPGKTLPNVLWGAFADCVAHLHYSNGGVVNAACLVTRIRVLCAGWGDATGSSRDWTCLQKRRWHPPPSRLNVAGWI